TPARRGVPFVGGMPAAWGAVEAFTRTLSAELGPQGIRVVCLRSEGMPETGTIDEVFGLHARAHGITSAQFQSARRTKPSPGPTFDTGGVFGHRGVSRIRPGRLDDGDSREPERWHDRGLANVALVGLVRRCSWAVADLCVDFRTTNRPSERSSRVDAIGRVALDPSSKQDLRATSSRTSTDSKSTSMGSHFVSSSTGSTGRCCSETRISVTASDLHAN